MFLIYNFQIIDEKDLKIDFQNRNFQYNDGFFDTLIFRDNKILFLKDHLDRIEKAIYALELLSFPQLNSLESFREIINILIEKNNLISETIRIKINIWRKSGGLFTPEFEEPEILISVQKQILLNYPIQKAEFYYDFRNRFTPLSFFKGPYSVHYVKGSIFKKKQGFDELILFDENDNISECLVSNIFWIKNNQIYTPRIETGCIAGIMRLNIIRTCENIGILLTEGFYKISDLLDAELIFTSNVTGLRPILKLNERIYPQNHPLLNNINNQLLYI